MRFLKLFALLALFSFPGFISNTSADIGTFECPTSVEVQYQMVDFIKATNPNIDPSDAVYIAKTLQEKSQQYGLNLIVFSAIVAQESSFRLNLLVEHGGQGNRDIGLGQVSSYWVKKWKLDPNRLRYDVAYNLDVSARILKSVYDENPNDPKAYSRYYNPLPAFRKTYEKLIDARIKLASR
jgi:soluble lytic murein transglycosylase-like protein